MNFFLGKVSQILVLLIFLVVLLSGYASAENEIIQIRKGYVVTPAYEVNTTGWEEIDEKKVEFFDLSLKSKLSVILDENIPFASEIIMLLIYSGFITFFGFRYINRKNVFKNKNRKEIFALIEKKPGIHFSGILKELNITKSMAKYHLDILASFGIIKLFSENGHSGYFKNNDSFTISEMKFSLIRKNPKDKLILDLLISNPGITRRELANETDLSGPSITWHMKRLQDLGYVKIVKEGRKTRYFLN